eukprot:CAMPEP_0118937780 /NCGR_PEP_ID=MMETSP1169-20130426/23808_1 /TAXON_ID=36882 /ORGANISM="Pyramimonas obovata, Strain CCMP722" /LENGTH=95 /DNA_ID=CAMNT_0006881525 /DNA_START=115 /DNA_END=403 /DNA_ORIENTATION=+
MKAPLQCDKNLPPTRPMALLVEAQTQWLIQATQNAVVTQAATPSSTAGVPPTTLCLLCLYDFSAARLKKPLRATAPHYPPPLRTSLRSVVLARCV